PRRNLRLNLKPAPLILPTSLRPPRAPSPTTSRPSSRPETPPPSPPETPPATQLGTHPPAHAPPPESLGVRRDRRGVSGQVDRRDGGDAAPRRAGFWGGLLCGAAGGLRGGDERRGRSGPDPQANSAAVGVQSGSPCAAH